MLPLAGCFGGASQAYRTEAGRTSTRGPGRGRGSASCAAACRLPAATGSRRCIRWSEVDGTPTGYTGISTFPFHCQESTCSTSVRKRVASELPDGTHLALSAFSEAIGSLPTGTTWFQRACWRVSAKDQVMKLDVKMPIYVSIGGDARAQLSPSGGAG